MTREFGNVHSVTWKRQSLKEESRVRSILEIKREMPFFVIQFCMRNWGEIYIYKEERVRGYRVLICPGERWVCPEGMVMSRGWWVYPGVGIPWNWYTPERGFTIGPRIPTYPHPQVLTPSGSQQNTHGCQAGGMHSTGMHSCFLFADEEASLCVDALNLDSRTVIMMAVNDHSSAYSAGGSHW